MEQAGSPLPSAPVCSPFRLSKIKAEAGFQQPGGGRKRRMIFEGRTKALRAAAPTSRDRMPPRETPLVGQEPGSSVGLVSLATLRWALGSQVPRNSFAA